MTSCRTDVYRGRVLIAWYTVQSSIFVVLAALGVQSKRKDYIYSALSVGMTDRKVLVVAHPDVCDECARDEEKTQKILLYTGHLCDMQSPRRVLQSKRKVWIYLVLSA